jgi:hypothetical protein
MKSHGFALLASFALACSPVFAQNVKVTPLGSHTGELCDRDRATIFEDPTGVRILYDARHTVAGASVIATHVNEGATVGGKVRPESRTAAFTNLVKGRPVYLALSGKTMEFDGAAKCVAGC